jgi:coproporphyrinogen III oxidase-like Fe-S oxidoreductase
MNNLTASPSMHRAIADRKLSYLPATTRTMYRIYLDRWFSRHGYRPISGFGYSRSNGQEGVIQNAPKFLYHDILYGYHDDEIIGYGASAMSQVPNYNLYNPRTKSYIRKLLADKELPWNRLRATNSPERGIVTFPYRGELDKRRVPWDLVPTETWVALYELQKAGLVVDDCDRYLVSKVGWLYYVNLMYYLMPKQGKESLSNNIIKQYRDGRLCGETTLEGLPDLKEWEA